MMAPCRGFDPLSRPVDNRVATPAASQGNWCVWLDSNEHCTVSRTAPSAIWVKTRIGEPGRARSDNPRLKRTVLCQLSYGFEDSAGDDPASSNLKGWRSA